jgi:predicted glycosyl hydrolase (DUF1957 family)
MLSLALVIELHHPLPGPSTRVAPDWVHAALECYWPILRAIRNASERSAGPALTLAVSPSWMALAADGVDRQRTLSELTRGSGETEDRQSLRHFVTRHCNGDAAALLRALGSVPAVEIIPTTSSHTWLPSVASDPVIARAQISLAAWDHSRRMGTWPAGIWLPYGSYHPGLESYMGEARLRYFGVSEHAFLRGTVRPPHHLAGPLVTAPGVACFGVNLEATRQVGQGAHAYGRDPRYLDARRADGAAAEHALHFLTRWRALARQISDAGPTLADAISVAAISAHELWHGWPANQGSRWLEHVLEQMGRCTDAVPLSLGHYLDRHPSGPLGTPGASAGGILAARPHGSNLFDRCRAAAELLKHAIEQRARLDAPGRRCVAQMTRHLLLAQQIDWELASAGDRSPEAGLLRSSQHLDAFYELGGLLLAGRLDLARLKERERGPSYLPEIDLDRLASG